MERGGEAVGDEDGTMGQAENGGHGEGAGRKGHQQVQRTEVNDSNLFWMLDPSR